MPRIDLPAAPVEDHHRTKGLVRLTMACGERCSFCNVPVEDHDQTPLAEEEVEDALRDFAASGERTLTISGGEPTLLRSRLVSLVASARGRGIPFVELQTNAVLLELDYAEELRDAGLTSAFVSLLSHDVAIHDELMGREGAHEACLRGIDALCKAGVAVTLNPVITQAMQERLGDYVDFVARRLPDVRSISLSVVQPHGRAAAVLELLPDYALLAPSVRVARSRGEIHGIELLNPYCGLPLCVGWESALERSVEAVEAAQRRGASVDGGVGVDNRGDKRQGPPCRRCALRTRCGGAWHAYWELRQGSGLAPPLTRMEPWEEGADAAEGQQVVRAAAGIDEAVSSRLAAATAPTVWLVVDTLRQGDAARILSSGCSDLALSCGARELLAAKELARELRELSRRQRERPPQARLRIALRLVSDGSLEDGLRALELASALGVEAVTAPRTVERRLLVTARRRRPSRLDEPLIEPAPADPTIDELRELARSTPGAGILWLAGGEPTLRADLPQLLRALTPLAPAGLGLCTDGLALSNDRALAPQREAGLSAVRIGLHAPLPEAHDWLVGQDGAARRALRALRACAAAGLRIEVASTVTRPAAAHLAELVVLARRLGASALQLSLLRARGAAERSFASLAPRLPLLSRALEDAEREARRRGLELILNDLPACAAGNLARLCSDARAVRWLVPAAAPWGAYREALDAPAASPGCSVCPGPPACAGAPGDYLAAFGWDELERRKSEEPVAILHFRFGGPSRVACRSCGQHSCGQHSCGQHSCGQHSDEASAPESSRDIRQRLVRAAGRGVSLLRLASAATLAHPQAAAMLADLALLSFERVEVAGEASALDEMSDAELRALRFLSRLDVALYGPDADRHDAHMDRPGSFAAALRGAERLARLAKVPVGAYAVIHDAADVADYARAWEGGDLPGEPVFQLSPEGGSLAELARAAASLAPGPARAALEAACQGVARGWSRD